jgi:hypothetical protein
MAFNLGQAFATLIGAPVGIARGIGQLGVGGFQALGRGLGQIGSGIGQAWDLEGNPGRAFASTAEMYPRSRQADPGGSVARVASYQRQASPPVSSTPDLRVPGNFYDGGLAEGRAGRLTVGGNEYDYISGGFGRGYIPEGQYAVSNPRLRSDGGFAVDGYGFSFDLNDRYDKRVGDTRSLLRVHPDGGKCGTQGCVGIQGGKDVQQQFYQDLRAQIEAGNPYLQVRYHPTANDYLNLRR